MQNRQATTAKVRTTGWGSAYPGRRGPFWPSLLGTWILLLATAASGWAQQSQQASDLEPAEVLDGPPLVTCKAWAIADGRTGELLFGHREDQQLDNASTTKMMTAWLVLQLAQKHPEIMDDEVVFSKRADGTSGSTAGIREGERLSVRELLYGLLLPSGNDASVALAEHFGGRFAAAEETADKSETRAGGGGDKDSSEQVEKKPTKGADDKEGPAADEALERFVAEMNREAERLGMKNTAYKNPHGLTAKGHGSSARDLLILARAALADESFRRYVATREHRAELAAADGAKRELACKNTNRLLRIAGYDGVKTGTTGAAGACLVSSGRRGEDHLLVVVLGATSPDARYVDSRNLFRWAWQQRGHK